MQLGTWVLFVAFLLSGKQATTPTNPNQRTLTWDLCFIKITIQPIINRGEQRLYTLHSWWKTEVVPQPFRIRYRSALWLRSNFLNPSEFPPCILTCSKKFLPWGWAIRWDVRGIWTIGPTKCRSLSERPPDLSVPQCVTLSVWERRNNFLTQSAEVTNAKVTNANAH